MHIPQVIIGTDLMIQFSGLSSRSVREQTAASHNETNNRVLLSQLHSLGFKAVLCPYDLSLLSMFKDIRGTKDFEIYPVIVNLVQYSRYLQQYGTIGFAARRVLKAGVLGIFDIVFIGLRHMQDILKKDFKYVCLVLASIEMAEFRKFKPSVIFLHSQISDLALANDNKKLFDVFATFIRNRFKAEPGLMSNNIGFLLNKLDEWGLDIIYVAGPVNRQGYHMKPSQHICEELITNNKRVIIATEVNSVQVPGKADVAYLKELNVSSFVTEFGSAIDALQLSKILDKFKMEY